MRMPRAVAIPVAAILLAGLAACASGPPNSLAEAGTKIFGGEKVAKSHIIPNFEQNKVAQNGPSACWAASAEMVGRYYGRPESQEQIAARIQNKAAAGGGTGEAIASAGEYEIMRALVPEAAELTLERYMNMIFAPGQTTIAPGMALTPMIDAARRDKDQFVVEAVVQDRPVVLGLKNKPGAASFGHAVVVYGVNYKEWSPSIADRAVRVICPAGDQRETVVEVTSLTIADPERGDPVEMSGDEFRARRTFVLTDELARQYLAQLDSAVHK